MAEQSTWRLCDIWWKFDEDLLHATIWALLYCWGYQIGQTRPVQPGPPKVPDLALLATSFLATLVASPAGTGKIFIWLKWHALL